MAPQDVLGERVEVHVGVVDGIGGDLDGKADRDAQIPGVDVQVDDRDRESIGNGRPERSLVGRAQVGGTKRLPGLRDSATPELDRVPASRSPGRAGVGDPARWPCIVAIANPSVVAR
jgi:hypothetical protein